MSRFCKGQDGFLTLVFDHRQEVLDCLEALYYIAKKYEDWPESGVAVRLKIKEQEDGKSRPQQEAEGNSLNA